MDVSDITKKHLEDNGFDGLYSQRDCGCKKDDLAPCGEMQSDCEAGYLQECPSDCGEHDWHIGSKQPGTVSRTLYVMRSKAGDLSIETEPTMIQFGWTIESDHEVTIPVKKAATQAIEYKGES